MYIGFKHLHSVIAYVSLSFLLIAVVYAVYGVASSIPYTKKSKTITLLGLIGAHVQILVGFVLYFLSPLGLSNFSGASMKNALSRLYILEHPLMMLISVALITIGYSKAKRLTEDKKKFKTVAVFYSIGLILILSRIPWAIWLN